MAPGKAPAKAAMAAPKKARAPRGAKTRAVGALVGKKAAESMTREQLFAFWSARIMRVPPPLRTSFGNFTTVNSVERMTFFSSTVSNFYLWIPWTPSPIAALSFSGGSGASIIQHLYNTLTTSAPLMVRPLRSSWSIECTTQMVNAAGSIRVYSYDNSIASTYSLSTASTGPCSLTNGGDAVLAPLINSAPESEEFSSISLATEHEWVSVPSSYPAYNSYYSFIPFAGTTDTALLQSSDLFNLVAGEVLSPSPFPIVVGSAPIVGGQNGSAGLGGLPPMRGFLVEFPITPAVQTFRVCFHRQDGARYPVNTLGATFATNPPKMSAASEDTLLDLAKVVTLGPSVPQVASVVSAATGFANQLNTGLAVAGGVAGALLSASSKVGPMVAAGKLAYSMLK